MVLSEQPTRIVQQNIISTHLSPKSTFGPVCLDYPSNIRSVVSKEPPGCSLFSSILRETWSAFALLQVSKLCYSYALEIKHMFSSRLLREPTCYLYPITGRRGMIARSSSAFSSSELPLIKRNKQSVIFFPPPNHVHGCVALAPVCLSVFVHANVSAPSLVPHLHIKNEKNSYLSCLDDNCTNSKAHHTSY